MEDNVPQAFNWHSALDQTYQEVSQKVVEHTPFILGATALLLVGWLAAHLLKLASKKLVQGLNSLFRRAARADGVDRERIKESYAQIIGSVVFWCTLIFFAAASANLLGWKMFSDWMDHVVAFLPSLVTGLVIMLAGYLLSILARSAISGAIARSSVPRSAMLPRIAQAVVFVSFLIVGAEQIGLNVHFLTNIVVVVVGILLAGAALAFGLGAKTMIANILGSTHSGRFCKVGEQLEIAGFSGEIIEITRNAIVLETEKGKAIVPAKLFDEQASFIPQKK